MQEVIVQNFLPKPGTAMAKADPCPAEDLQWAIAAARLVLPPEIHVQAPPNLSDELAPLLDAGIDDWGGVSPVTADHVNPERAWPALDVLREATEAAGHVLAPRLTVYPTFALDPGRWLDPALRFAVLDASDAEGLARDAAWCSGGEEPPPPLLERAVAAAVPRPAAGAVAEVLAGVALGQEVGEAEIVTLFSARGPEVRMVAEVADDLRRQTVGDAVTFVRNRNINYTNVCTFKCRFCAFSKGPLSLNLRGAPYLLELDEITRRVAEAEDEGATEVCLQGGIHPNFDGDYYLHVLEAVRAASADIHIHGFTALEVTEGARRSEVPLAEYLTRLKEAGLKTLPGHGGRDPRRRGPRRDLPRQDLHRRVAGGAPDRALGGPALEHHDHVRLGGAAVQLGPPHGAHPGAPARDRRLHRVRAAALRAHGHARSTSSSKARRGPTFRETLLMHAVARIAYAGDIDNIQVSWVKMGGRGGAPGAAGRGQRPGRDPDGREHLAGGGGAARATHGRRGAGGHRGAARAPLVQRSTLYALAGASAGA